MKKILIGLLALTAALPSLAQWSAGTGTIYPTTLTNKVGIGHNSPSTWLHILGITEQLRVGYDASNYVSFTTGSSGGLTITRNGIGTSTESVAFAGSNGELAVTSNNNTSTPAFYLRGNGTGDLINVLDGATNAFTIKDGGNVGIGTAAPANLLEVSGNGAVPLTVTRTTVSSNVGIEFKNASASWFAGQASNGNFGIATSSNIATSAILNITSGGNVGVGTASPADKLHVVGNGGVMISNNGFYGLRLYNLSDNSQKMHLYWRPTDDVIEMNTGGGTGRQISFVTNGTERLRISASGSVGIGTTTPDQKLTVNGTIHSTEVKVDLSVPGPDYVFEPGYALPSLGDVRRYVSENHRLPGMPSAAEMQKEGIKLSEMNMKLLKAVEELTLHAIDQQGQIDSLRKELSHLKKSGRKRQVK